MLRGDSRHGLHPLRRFGAHHAAFAADEIVLERAFGVVAPACRQLPEHAVEDHREEVVDERRVPPRQQLAPQIAIRAREFVGTLIAQRDRRRRERLVQTHGETRDLARQPQVVQEEADQRARERECVEELAALRGRRDGDLDRFRQALAHAHHLLHELPVHGEAGEQREHAVPVQQVVIQPAANQAEHVPERVVFFGDHAIRHAHQAAELTVDALIDLRCERKRQRRRDAAVAFDDVAVVPDGEFGVGIGGVRERRDRTRLQEIERARLRHGPFDVLRPAEMTAGVARERGHGDHLAIGEARVASPAIARRTMVFVRSTCQVSASRLPETRSSPMPATALTIAMPRRPVTGSAANATPAARGVTMRWTITAGTGGGSDKP